MKINEDILRRLIKEELGVACEVSDNSNKILSQIQEEIKEKKFKKGDYYNECTGRFDFSFLNSIIKITYTYRNFKDKDYFEYTMKKNPEYRDGSSIFFNKKQILMDVCLCGYSGNIDKVNAIDTISHELEHIYQQMKIGSGFGQTLYNKIRMGLKSNNSNKYEAARLLYGCIKSEQEGYCNGLYSYLMACPSIIDYNSLDNSECYKLYIEIKEIFEKSYKNKELLKYILDYGISINEIKKKIKNFQWRIGRILAKVEEDKIKYQGWRK